ncbi:DUF465 domain-containing protein [Novosphingobium sp. FSY-8]|uniref:DUF465 domain-containing protein n=1 Tax=Novosphingobium ovatum TaxID=1908523 RepID=A0ABW9XH63_9SPHN|nr:YdcH family protein [Novosphingobium ovatum]NBC37826.1 DUF465 domain-containing protein [Novosphingobium ovatum]
MESSHASALLTKHAGLEKRIQQEMTRRPPDLSMIKALKKQKLRIKDELSHG